MATISKSTGCEGPRHDPYSFTEYTFQRTDGLEVTMHAGLGVWIQMEEVIDGQRIRFADGSRLGMSEEEMAELWYHATGIPLNRVEAVNERVHPYFDDPMGPLSWYE